MPGVVAAEAAAAGFGPKLEQRLARARQGLALARLSERVAYSDPAERRLRWLAWLSVIPLLVIAGSFPESASQEFGAWQKLMLGWLSLTAIPQGWSASRGANLPALTQAQGLLWARGQLAWSPRTGQALAVLVRLLKRTAVIGLVSLVLGAWIASPTPPWGQLLRLAAGTIAYSATLAGLVAGGSRLCHRLAGRRGGAVWLGSLLVAEALGGAVSPTHLVSGLLNLLLGLR